MASKEEFMYDAIYTSYLEINVNLLLLILNEISKIFYHNLIIFKDIL